jgi:hypothetical protein
MKATPIYSGANTEIFARPSFDKIKNELLVKNKKEFDLGFWSSAGLEDSQLLVQKLLGRQMQQLLFVTFTDREKEPIAQEFYDPNHVKPAPLARNLANIWAKYPQYSEENTLMVSNFYNEIEDFQRNDIVIPQFDPKSGSTDFLDDLHLDYLN